MPTKTTRKRKSKRGGRREGAGRPSMFTGPRKKVTHRLTLVAIALIEKTTEQLQAEFGDATDTNAIEYLIRKATNTPLEQ